MIHPKAYPVNDDLARLLKSLEREMQRKDEEAISGIVENMECILQVSSARATPYNAVEITTIVTMQERGLPTINRNTYRPQHYLHVAGIEKGEETVPFSLIIPFPLETEAPYEMHLKMYPAKAGRVPGMIINLGKREPIHLFFYIPEIKSICIGHAVANEYARLVVKK